MLPQIGATELILVAVIALIVVGPKDLPLMMRRLGQFVARMRAMAHDFRASLDELATQSELDELRREVAAMRAGRYMEAIADPEAEQIFEEIGAELHARPAPELAAPVEELPAPAPKPKRKRAPAKKKAAAPAAKKPRARKTPETGA